MWATEACALLLLVHRRTGPSDSSVEVKGTAVEARLTVCCALRPPVTIYEAVYNR
jgi:hypothetical protein